MSGTSSERILRRGRTYASCKGVLQSETGCVPDVQLRALVDELRGEHRHVRGLSVSFSCMPTLLETKTTHIVLPGGILEFLGGILTRMRICGGGSKSNEHT